MKARMWSFEAGMSAVGGAMSGRPIETRAHSQRGDVVFPGAPAAGLLEMHSAGSPLPATAPAVLPVFMLAGDPAIRACPNTLPVSGAPFRSRAFSRTGRVC